MSYGFEIRDKYGNLSVRQDGYSMRVHKHLIGYITRTQSYGTLLGDYVTLPGWFDKGHKIAIYNRFTSCFVNSSGQLGNNAVSSAPINPYANTNGRGIAFSYTKVDNNTIFVMCGTPDYATSLFPYHLIEYSYG